MIIKIDNIAFNILIDDNKKRKEKIPIVFLHGFTGSSEDWQFLFDKLPTKYLPIAIDLIGHGKTDSPENPKFYTTESITYQLNKIFLQLGLTKLIITGYSMGGRAALSYCMKYPQSIIGAILESTIAGIQDFDQKKERVEFDFLLSERIKLEGVEKFLEYWFNIPLFESLKDLDNLEQIKKNRSTNNVVGLSNILAGFSTGLMPSYWNRLNKINYPVLLISGALDIKYTEINSKMAKLIPNSVHKIAERSGHNVHLENPGLFTKFVTEFIQANFNG